GFRPVEAEFCAEPPPSTVQLCNIPCPSDCLVSPWTEWGPCIHENCLDPHGRKGFKFRRREVVVEPPKTSGNCPHVVESVPCEDPVCYRWAVSGQLHCVPENGECGHGKYDINTTCLGENGESPRHYLPSLQFHFGRYHGNSSWILVVGGLVQCFVEKLCRIEESPEENCLYGATYW
ncbi:hypothetical protein GDO81_025364, partial [Engystomops pustulosus]